MDNVSGENSSAQNRQSARGRHHTVVIVGVIVLVIAAVAGAIYYWYSTFYESTDDAYIEGHPVVVSARVSGNIRRVHVTDNQWVAKGTLLVEIDPCDYQARYDQAEASVRAAQAAEIQVQADIEVAQAQLTREQQDLERYEKLAQENAVAYQDLQHSRASTRVAQADLSAARVRLTNAHAQTAASQAAADVAGLQLSYTKVYTLQAGHVTERSAVEGSFVSVGQSLLTIVTDEMYIVANFKETQLTRMRPGQPVTISVDAYPSVRLKGHVDSIQAGTGAVFSLFPPQNATGNFVKVVQRIPVKIVFEKPTDPDYFLTLGMSVEPKVKVK
jgi:membrane fusion protein (multidrug efflux system)